MDRKTANTLWDYNPATGDLRWKIKPSFNVEVGDVVSCVEGKGYIVVKRNYKRYYAHRIIWLMVYGNFPEYEIDHINGDRSDNRLSNLRDATHRQNQKNRRINHNAKLSIHGVRWRQKEKVFVAYINSAGKQRHLGYAHDFFEACCLRKAAEAKYNYHINHGRA